MKPQLNLLTPKIKIISLNRVFYLIEKRLEIVNFCRKLAYKKSLLFVVPTVHEQEIPTNLKLKKFINRSCPNYNKPSKLKSNRNDKTMALSIPLYGINYTWKWTYSKKQGYNAFSSKYSNTLWLKVEHQCHCAVNHCDANTNLSTLYKRLY